MTKVHSKQLNIPLMENALDFIDKGLKEFNEHRDSLDPKLLKYVALHIHAGIELIFKARLVVEHWSFIFKDLDKANKVSYENGDFVSIDMDAAVKRLKALCGVELSQDFKGSCDDLRKKRNKIDHFEINENVNTLVSCITTTLAGTIDFITNEIGLDNLDEQENNILASINAGVKNNEDYVQARLLLIEPRLSGLKLVIECPRCGQQAFVLDSKQDLCECYFCNYKPTDCEEVADEYVENVLHMTGYSCAKDGMPWPVTECIECGSISFIDYPENYFCFDCKNKFEDSEVDHCSCCGALIDSSKEMSICDNCLEYKSSRD